MLAAGDSTAVVVDAGPDPGPADRCLRDLGVTRVPLLVLTHFHADHVAGLPGVLRGRAIGAIQTTVSEDPRNRPRSYGERPPGRACPSSARGRASSGGSDR